MKILLLTAGFSLAFLPTLATAQLPPPREAAQDAVDDLPPPRATTRQSRPAPDASPAAVSAPVPVSTADDLPPPRTTARRPVARGFQPSFKAGVDDLLLETGGLPDAPEADLYSTVRASAYVQWQPSREWEFRAGARLDGMAQSGGVANHREWLADYTDTYARYRSGDTRLTLGAQTIIWGRADEIPLADRVSRADLTRFLLDDLPDRRRAQLAARWEQTFGEYKLDAVILPVFRGAQLPDVASVWSPVNRSTGRIIGIDPALTGWVSTAAIRQDEKGSGGGGVRLTRTGEPFDFGVTVARTRQSLPYYRLDAGPSLTAVHPYNTFVGADFETVTGALTWRMEVGLTDDVPVTLPTTEMAKTRSLDWIGALEFFPGGKDTRINLQLVAHALQTDRSTLELKEYYGINGELETTFGQGRWRAAMRFASGINVHDVYVSPRVSYVGWEPHEIYLAAHYFDGEARSLGGFHKDHSMITLGLRTRF